MINLSDQQVSFFIRLKEVDKEDMLKNIQQKQLPTQYSILAADLSLNGPGFCILKVQARKIKECKTFHIDNHIRGKSTNEKLEDIANMILRLGQSLSDPFYMIKEQSIRSHSGVADKALNRVAGVSQYVAWTRWHKQWVDIMPNTIKLVVTGNGHAEKDQVAAALDQWIGQHEYANDDQSDAAAVGITWLLKLDAIDKI